MKVQVDTETAEVVVEQAGVKSTHKLTSPEAFDAISKVWLRAGWDTKYVYTFSWMGRPIIQLPEDMVRVQEVIYAVKPKVIVETGVAHGGSLVFYASLMKAMAIPDARVIGIDIEIRQQNRKAIEAHPLKEMIELVEGSSTAAETLARVKSLMPSGGPVLVMLDSNHTRAHVLAELELYSPLVTVGSYCVAADGIMKDVVGAPRTNPNWGEDNPVSAVEDFLKTHKGFVEEQPQWLFDESTGLRNNVTYWPKGYLKRQS